MNREPEKKIPSLSIFFPAYNDGGTIPSMALTAQIAARTVTNDYEIIVVNDGSQDYTALVLAELEKQIPRLRVIHHSQNQGYGSTLRSGFSAATKEWIFYTDGDAQYNPLELINLANALTEKVDLVNGYKIARSDPLIRKIIGRIYHYMVSVAFGIHLRDIDCDFRLIRRNVLAELNLESKSGAICVELTKKIQDKGCAFIEVPVHHYHRQYGRSQFFNFRRIFRVFRQLLILYWKLVIKKEHLSKQHVQP